MSAPPSVWKELPLCLRWCLDRPNPLDPQTDLDFSKVFSGNVLFDASGDGWFCFGCDQLIFLCNYSEDGYRLNPAFLAKVEASGRRSFGGDLKNPADQESQNIACLFGFGGADSASKRNPRDR